MYRSLMHKLGPYMKLYLPSIRRYQLHKHVCMAVYRSHRREQELIDKKLRQNLSEASQTEMPPGGIPESGTEAYVDQLHGSVVLYLYTLGGC
jgi:hypothetical protein